MTDESQALSALCDWYWANRNRELTGELLEYYNEPEVNRLVEATADLLFGGQENKVDS